MLLALALALTAMRGSDLPVAVCVVAPRVEALSQGDARGEVPLGAPRLVVIEPLLEVRIERPGQPPWQRLAGQGQVIQGPLDWPVAPIAPNETVLIRLRPQLAPEGAYAHVELKGAPAGRMLAAEALVRRLGKRTNAWGMAIEQALLAGNVPLAWALLFHPSIPADPELEALRAEVIRRGCGD
ncbi:MAG: hypothetical protein VKL23_07925 [Cyanobacteriota bacterium]|jgi:hypothetical protein|nr:hypothetical protein [Cyanobacteriota bacterium]